jgi:hypothetical protein
VNGEGNVRIVVGYLIHGAWDSITLASIVVNDGIANKKSERE